MLQTIQVKSITALQYLVETLESYDDNVKREKVFAKSVEPEDSDEEPTTARKVIQIGANVVDITLHQTQKRYSQFKESPVYDLTDDYVQYDKNLDILKTQSFKMYKFMNDRVYFPLRENLIMIYDSTQDYVSFLIRIAKEHQSQVYTYIKEHYDNVRIVVKENWMKLDFDKDGLVSVDDLREGMLELYQFMKSFEYVAKAQEIKSTVYQQAI